MSKPTEPRIRWMLIHDRAANEADNPKALVEVTRIYNAIRYIFSLDRWPEDMSRPDLRDNFKAAWGELGGVADLTDWSDLPEFQPVPGNDYIDSIGHVLRTARIEPPRVTVRVGDGEPTVIEDSTWADRAALAMAGAA